MKEKIAIAPEEKVTLKKKGKRARIPSDVERAVLVEAGHRCAVCGDPCPLERAHIIPWRISKEHKAEDLILLCANCHQRADLENWGEKTLRDYKRVPWILRRQAERLSMKGSQRVKITLGLKLCDFDITQQRLLVYAIAAFLDIPPEEVVVSSVEEGSVKVTIALPAEAATRLLTAFEQNDSTLFELLSHSFPISAGRDDQESAAEEQPSSANVSLEEFLGSISPRLRPTLARYRIPPGDVEDLVQQALLDLVYQRNNIRDPEAWLIGALRNKCLQYWRSKRSELINYPDIEESKPGEILVKPPLANEALVYLRRVVRELFERWQSEAVVLHRPRK